MCEHSGSFVLSPVEEGRSADETRVGGASRDRTARLVVGPAGLRLPEYAWLKIKSLCLHKAI